METWIISFYKTEGISGFLNNLVVCRLDAESDVIFDEVYDTVGKLHAKKIAQGFLYAIRRKDD